jgi:hypothetical protein
MNEMRGIVKYTNVFALVFFSGFISGCGNATSKTPATASTPDPAIVRAKNTWNKHIVDTAVSLLRSGYIVLRRGLGADSYMLAEMNRRNKTYSHCGIVMVEQGYPFIYHSIGGEDNPDERLRRDSANFFFSPRHNTHLAVIRYSLDTEQVSSLKQVVADYYRQRPRFDMKFDLTTDDKLYCSEFIYKAVNKAVGDTAYIGTSMLLKRRQVGIDDLFMNSHASMVWEVKFK